MARCHHPLSCPSPAPASPRTAPLTRRSSGRPHPRTRLPRHHRQPPVHSTHRPYPPRHARRPSADRQRAVLVAGLRACSRCTRERPAVSALRAAHPTARWGQGQTWRRRIILTVLEGAGVAAVDLAAFFPTVRPPAPCTPVGTPRRPAPAHDTGLAPSPLDTPCSCAQDFDLCGAVLVEEESLRAGGVGLRSRGRERASAAHRNGARMLCVVSPVHRVVAYFRVDM